VRVGANSADFVRDCLSTVCTQWGWFSRSCGLVADSSSALLNTVSMRRLLYLAPNARRVAQVRSLWWTVQALSSTPPRMEVRGLIRTNREAGRATTSAKTAKPS
jgi:hypothetical protein